MRVILDTNVLVSALLVQSSAPARLVELWRDGSFVLLTSAEQMEELRRVTRYPKLRTRIAPSVAGRLINEVRARADMVDAPPAVALSSDPFDNHLLAAAISGRANFLVTGDRPGLLALAAVGTTRIVTVAAFLQLTKRRR